MAASGENVIVLHQTLQGLLSAFSLCLRLHVLLWATVNEHSFVILGHTAVLLKPGLKERINVPYFKFIYNFSMNNDFFNSCILFSLKENRNYDGIFALFVVVIHFGLM